MNDCRVSIATPSYCASRDQLSLGWYVIPVYQLRSTLLPLILVLLCWCFVAFLVVVY